MTDPAEPESQVVTQRKEYDRGVMTVGQETAKKLLQAVRAVTMALANPRDKILFWHGVLAETIGNMCSDLGYDNMAIALKQAEEKLLPKLKRQIDKQAEEVSAPASKIIIQ